MKFISNDVFSSREKKREGIDNRMIKKTKVKMRKEKTFVKDCILKDYF